LRSGLGWSVLPPRVEAEIVGTADVGKNVFARMLFHVRQLFIDSDNIGAQIHAVCA